MIVLKKLNFQIFPSEITCLADSMHVDLTAVRFNSNGCIRDAYRILVKIHCLLHLKDLLAASIICIFTIIFNII